MRHLNVPLVLLVTCSMPACGDDAGGGDGESGESGGMLDGPLWPMVDGADWTYVEMNAEGQVMNTDHISVESSTFEGADAFLMIDGSKHDTLTLSDGVLGRVRRDRYDSSLLMWSADYEPALVLVDEAWRDAAAGELLELDLTRTQTDAEGMNPVSDARNYVYTLIAVDEEVEVPAGTFIAVHVQRETTTGESAGEVVDFWFAPGVGKVQEHQLPNADAGFEEKWERLVSYSLPEG